MATMTFEKERMANAEDGKAKRLGKPRALHFDASALWSLAGGRQESHVSEGVELGFIGHAYDQNEHLREEKDTWQEV